MRRVSNYTSLARDGFLTIASLWIAILLRFEGNPPGTVIQRALWLSPLLFSVFVVAGKLRGLYRDLPQYTSIWELTGVAEAVALTTIALLAFARFVRIDEEHFVPLSVPLICALIMLYALGAARLYRKLLGHIGSARTRDPDQERVLIVGAGDAGEMIARDMLRNPASKLEPVGFLDDAVSKQGRRIHGKPVVGPISDLERAVQEFKANYVIIAMPSVASRIVRKVVQRAAATGAKAKIVASMRDMVQQPLTTADIRDVDVADLIGRKPVRTKTAEIGRFLRDRRVLVTGAAGSIGSELARQILRFGPSKLVVLDNNESGLFDLLEELKPESSAVIETAIADVRDQTRMNHVFASYLPEVVIHSAAYKHVPLMEAHPAEAVITNVIGTRHVIEATAACRAKKFVLISSDKAVEPSSVMGATKRIAELMVAAKDEGSNTEFTAVRFGNVLGSRGSVVPTFMNQIRRGGPITVTSAEATRFFMTIEEAVALILQAASIAKDGEVFMLDMGEPVRILELAERMRDLLGQDTEDMPEIVISGIRKGEKLHEKLWGISEEALPSGRERIFRMRPNSPKENYQPRLRAALSTLESLSLARADEEEIKKTLFAIAGSEESEQPLSKGQQAELVV